VEVLLGASESSRHRLRGSIADVLDEHFDDQRLKDALCPQG